ncbi:MAG: ferrochelatase [Gammaproteobacteria bacterium]|nr:ferrochelatase [Gammaproteobacteria bacterium]
MSNLDFKPRIGVLLTNLGTPDAPTAKALRKYLAEFLSDPRVIEKPRWIWKIILYGIILNVRPKRAAKAYQKVWTENGSPLMEFSLKQSDALQKILTNNPDADFIVELAMRYGNPSISHGIESLLQKNIDKLIVLPLYPQYSATTTASIYDAVSQTISKIRNIPEIILSGAYHNNDNYISALANSIKEHWTEHGQSERLMMSFHGLPKNYITAGDPYQEQCLQTAELLAEKLQLPDKSWACAFQSRFGVEEWIQPYADKMLESWAAGGTNSVDIICPGFSADCLETIEETAMQNRDIFLQSGGKIFNYIPCLNDRHDHIKMMSSIIKGDR